MRPDDAIFTPVGFTAVGACVGTMQCMPAFEARVEVTHLPGIADPAGATVERALPALGYTNVSQVHIGKTIRLVVEADDAQHAQQEVEEMCERLLANPVIEAYEVTISELAR
jgi:phosphoribosylformylglycinamidine synthase subunit PurS